MTKKEGRKEYIQVHQSNLCLTVFPVMQFSMSTSLQLGINSPLHMQLPSRTW